MADTLSPQAALRHNGTVEPAATIVIRPRLVRRVLAITTAALIVMTYVAQFLKDRESALTFARLFDSDVKANFPTGFKIFALTASALAIWMIARHAAATGDRWARHWLLLAVVVALLALDETAWIHWSVGAWLHGLTDSSGALRFAWVALYLPAGLAVAAFLWRFFWALPPWSQVGFASAGVLFGGGSGILEMVKGVVVTDGHDESLRLMLVAATSDSLEFIGLSILLITALRELGSRTSEVKVLISDDRDRAERVGRHVDGDRAGVERHQTVSG
jgi:hypothetical protein